jgi:arylsulfatase A-like enzyme
MSSIRFFIAACLLGQIIGGLAAAAAEKPNVVLIYADDIGYGDLSCYGARSVSTPNLDRLAREGLKFTDAHSPSATCTPSRYALLTGEYAFRQKGTGVAKGDATMIISPGRVTLASILKNAGYKTGVVGKWHLGLGNPGMNWNGPITPGPQDLGFDEHFIIPATGDRVPCVYVENGRVAGIDPADPIRVSFEGPIDHSPTGKSNPELLFRTKPSHGHDMTIVNGISRIGYMTGGKKALWNDETMADDLTARALKFIESHKTDRFFLFFNTHDIHVPRVPHPRFVGKTSMGPRGDAIVQLDWCVGEVLKKLDELGLTKETMVLFSSDNGPVVDDGYREDAEEKLGSHKPAGPFRGGKYSNFEAGTRVPLLVRWPAAIKAGGESSALLAHVDFPASFAKITGQELPANAAPDSFDVADALMGRTTVGRDHLVEHAGVTSLRQGQWKFIPAGNGPKLNRLTNTEMGNDKMPQLYDLAADPGETKNLAVKEPQRLAEMRKKLESIKTGGSSRPGFKP